MDLAQPAKRIIADARSDDDDEDDERVEAPAFNGKSPRTELSKLISTSKIDNNDLSQDAQILVAVQVALASRARRNFAPV